MAQLGYVNVLPVRTRRFGNTVFAAEFTAIGALKSAGYEQKAAAAEGVATAFGSVVDATVPVINHMNQAETRARAAELAELEFLKKRRDALAALADSSNAEIAASAQALSAETALNAARISNIDSQILLAEAQRRLAGMSVMSRARPR